MNKLQNLTFPTIEIGAPEAMYFRRHFQSNIRFSQRVVEIPVRSSVSSDTFFNGFSVGKWRKHCDIRSLGLALHGTGSVLVRVGHIVLGSPAKWIQEVSIGLSTEPCLIEIHRFPALSDGMIFFEVFGETEATLTGGYYYTNDVVRNDVKLGVVITHFNRKGYVLPAIRRIKDQILDDADLGGGIRLIVVDNSQNIGPDEASGATVIPNRNLGGAGGFTRGLLHLKDNGFTHCLFMDDDASCEAESIRRTFRFMQFAVNRKLAIAGSMLSEREPHFLREVGACFKDGVNFPLKSGLDTINIPQLLESERSDRPIEYGAWWHFAFRIDQVVNYPFPFFVRGDDILFSILNDFEIESVMGVGVWGESFGEKESPTVRYLHMRAMIIIYLLTSRRNASRIIRLYRHLVKHCLYSYNYASARAFTLAVEHVLQGPKFWRDNVDMLAVRAQLSEECSGERLVPCGLPDDVEGRAGRETFLHRFLRKVSLNGFLLPNFMIRNRTTLDRKDFFGNEMTIYRFRRVMYRVQGTDLGYVATHDKGRFWIEFARAVRVSFALRREFNSLRAAYKSELESLTSEEFWRTVYKE